MSNLIDRYVAAATEHLPEGSRTDAARDIRVMVDELVEARIAAGEEPHIATTAVLNELGDPAQVARSFEERPQYLIGPGWFPLYVEILTRVLPIALVVVGVIAMITKASSSDAGLIESIATGVGSAIDIGLQVLLWVTVGVFIAERTIGPAPGAGREHAWTVSDLPDAPVERQIGLAETVGTVLTLLVFGGLAIVQNVRGLGFFIVGDASDWESLPLLNPDLGAGWAVGFGVVITVSVIVAIAGYLERAYTPRLVMLTALNNALWVGYIVALAASEPIFNPELRQRISDNGGNWWVAGERANRIVVIVIIAYALWDVWEAWSRYRGNRTMRDMAVTAA